MPIVLFSMDPQSAESVHQLRGRLQDVVYRHMHRHVRIQTIDGYSVEGVIVGVDGHHAYIRVQDYSRGFYNPAAAVIMPLVLYELLVIALLS